MKGLADDRKQMINNWVRQTYEHPNVAIWAVRSTETDRDALDEQIKECIRTGNWEHFSIEAAKGQAVGTIPKNEPQAEAELEEVTDGVSHPKEAEPMVPTELEDEQEEEKPVEVAAKTKSRTFAEGINRLIDREVEQRVAAYRKRIRAEVIAEIELK